MEYKRKVQEKYKRGPRSDFFSPMLPSQKNVGLAESEWGREVGGQPLESLVAPFHMTGLWASLRSPPRYLVKLDLQCPENVPAELLMTGVSSEQQSTTGAVHRSSESNIGSTFWDLNNSLESRERGWRSWEVGIGRN